MNKILAISTVLMAAAFTGIFSTTNPIAFAQDESETNTEQSIAQKNVGSGESTNSNCGGNSIDSGGLTNTITVTLPGILCGDPIRVPP
jgi:hypothetical protein